MKEYIVCRFLWNIKNHLCNINEDVFVAKCTVKIISMKKKIKLVCHVFKKQVLTAQ